MPQQRTHRFHVFILYLFSWASFKCLGHLQVSSHIGRPRLHLPHHQRWATYQQMHQFLRQASKWNPPPSTWEASVVLQCPPRHCRVVAPKRNGRARHGQWRTRWLPIWSFCARCETSSETSSCDWGYAWRSCSLWTSALSTLRKKRWQNSLFPGDSRSMTVIRNWQMLIFKSEEKLVL